MGDSKIVTELAMALVEKNEKFTIRDIPTLSEIMDAHNTVAPLATEPSKMVIEKGELEKSTYELNMKQMAYDLQAWKVFAGKMSDHYSAMAHMKLDWHMTAWKENMEAVSHYFENIACIACWEKGDVETKFQKFKVAVEKKFQLASNNVVLRIHYM